MMKSRRQRGRRARLFAVPLALAVALLADLGLAGTAQAADPTLTDAFDAVGTTHIGSINADVPLGPTTLTETLDLANSQVVDGTLPLPDQQVQFNALGFIPIRATTSFTQVGPVTGQLTNTGAGQNTLSSNVSYTIRLSNVQVSVFGAWIPLFVGDHCQTINPVNITAATPAGGNFTVQAGGDVTGAYTIGDFQNCAPLQLPDVFGIGSLPINALVPGTNNTLTLHLSNPSYVGSTS
ncbi:hypothetical protein [Kitasatospora viridis]|uniref:Ribosomally synthesized peptide with SipW-like signal peptide n=1 Tax=Kitasatospora viridis TaxID=281105 RepID=A0A561TV91_9ACTN|nr:hypothetical protein [Kitasatospora viridis]TWF91028.1 hypothetical protein FHX73_12140 [Kitasatospora viridis]